MPKQTIARPSVPNGRPDGLTMCNWDDPPYNRWSFQHMREIVPTQPIAQAVSPLPLEASDRCIDLDALTFADASGATVTARALIDRSFTDGFLVLHRGRVVCEEYHNRMTPQTLHIGHSVTKSVVAALVGVLADKGAIALDKTVAEYAPYFAEAAHRDVTIAQLLDMTSGVDFPEDTADPETGYGLIDISIGWKAVPHDNPSIRSLHDLIASLKRVARPHGAQFEYRSIETEVLGYCIEGAMGVSLADLISEHLWQPMGAEREASFGLDRDSHAVADGGLCACLRDFGRFGLIYAQDGAVNDQQVLPKAWVEETRNGDPSLFTAAQKANRPKGAYRNKFWIIEAGKPAIAGLGVFGQMVYVDHSRDFVGVKLSSWPDLINHSMRIDAQNLMHALAEELSSAS